MAVFYARFAGVSQAIFSISNRRAGFIGGSGAISTSSFQITVSYIAFARRKRGLLDNVGTVGDNGGRRDR